MKIGKVSESVLKRSILKQIKTKNKEILIGAGVGVDCAIFAPSSNQVVALCTNPIIISYTEETKLGIQSVINNLAVVGAKPLGIMLSLLLPESFFESQLKDLMNELEEICNPLQIQIMGGHTEITKTVNQPILTITGVGTLPQEQISYQRAIKPGMEIVMSKWIGLNGSYLIAHKEKERLLQRYSQQFLANAFEFDDFFSISAEAATAIKSGVSHMHDVSKSGIFGALWELAEGASVGLTVDLKKIPIRQETVEICEFFGLNPYELSSMGALLMVSDKGQELVDALTQQDIPACIIGTITNSNDRIILNEEETRYLERPKADEIYKVMK